MALCRSVFLALALTGFCPFAGIAAQSRQPLSGPLDVGAACDVGDNPAKLDARSFLIAEASTIVNFGSQPSLDPKYWEFRCVAARDETDGFALDFEGGGANMVFHFDDKGSLQSVDGRDNDQFIQTAAFLKAHRAMMFPEQRMENGEEIRNPLAGKIEEICPVYSRVSPLTVATAIEDTKECLLNLLNVRRDSALYPCAATLAVHNKYVANLPIQLVFVTPGDPRPRGVDGLFDNYGIVTATITKAQ